MRVAAALMSIVLLAAACGGGGTTTEQWCEANLDRVSAVGIKDGTQFEFGGARPAIPWPEFASDSEVERPIILAESSNGADIYDAACREAYAAK